MEKIVINEIINRFFIAADERDWETVKSSFSPEVLLDYISMAGGEPALL